LFAAGACTAPIGDGTRTRCSTSSDALPVEMKPASNRRLSRWRGLLLAATSRAYCRPQLIDGTGSIAASEGCARSIADGAGIDIGDPGVLPGEAGHASEGAEPARLADRRQTPGSPIALGLPVDEGARVGSRPEPVADPIDRRIDAGHAPRLIARGRAGGGSGRPLVAPGAALRHLSRHVAVAIVRA
jgi:hypothetical protein